MGSGNSGTAHETMTLAACRATIRGLPETPSITEVNARSGPGTNHDIVLKTPVGTSGLLVMDVHEDDAGRNFQGKMYQWFKLQFPDGKVAWVRDDLLEIVGDCRPYGYKQLFVQTFAFTQSREAVSPIQQPAQAEPVAQPMPQEDTAAPVTEPVQQPLPQQETPKPLVKNVEPLASPELKPEQPAQPAGETAAPPKATPDTQKTGTTPVPKPTTGEVKPVTTEMKPAPSMDGACVGLVLGRTGVNVRSGPSTNFSAVARFDWLAEVTIIGSQLEQGGGKFRWMRVNAKGVEGWIREDYVGYQGGCKEIGLTPDLYPAPMKMRWWIRDFNLTDRSIPEHWGWDLGADTGEPVLSAPATGLVMESFECQKCLPGKPNTLSQGFKLSDPAVLSDPGWGFGYGNYVIVRYLSDDLPETTQRILENNGLKGAHMFVMYAHLSQRKATVGDKIDPNTQIGACGNTGNSEASHLHLEVRASTNANETRWANMRKNLMTPAVLYRR